MVIAAAGAASAQALSGTELVATLKQGGYVLVMRHANSPLMNPDVASAAPGNTRLERQLSDDGHRTARAMGEALKALRIPIGAVLSSPTFRARETVNDLAVGAPMTSNELGDGSQGYELSPSQNGVQFMRARSAQSPRPGANTLIVTHLPNIESAFGEGLRLDDGEVLVLRPSGAGGTPIGRIKIDEWPRLAASR